MRISNHDPAFSWTATDSVSSAHVSIVGAVITVSGLPPGTASRLTVNSSRNGYQSGTATSSTYKSIAAGNVQLRWEPTQSTGILWSINNDAYTKAISVDNRYFSMGLTVKDLISNAGSQVTMAWKITDSSGGVLTNQPITLAINPAYESNIGQVKTLQGVAIPLANGGANDGLVVPLVSDSSGIVTYTMVNANTVQNSGPVPVDQLTIPTDVIATQMLIYLGTFPTAASRISAGVQLSQDIDITEIHWVGTPPVVAPGNPKVSGHVVGNLLWSDDFNETSTATIKSSNWTARYCGGAESNGGSTCMSNESQDYEPSAVALDRHGNLVITATHLTTGPSPGACLHNPAPCTFVSGRLDTQGKVSFKYGYLETRIKMPAGKGNWPAFWMIGTNTTSVGWPVAGEIDIAEQWGDNPTRNSAAVHYSTVSTPRSCCDYHLYDVGDYAHGINYSQDFHTYGFAWGPDSLSFYVDNNLFFTETPATARTAYWPYNAPFFLIINNAITDQSSGSNTWDGWNTSTMTVDYVKYYQLDGQGTLFTP